MSAARAALRGLAALALCAALFGCVEAGAPAEPDVWRETGPVATERGVVERVRVVREAEWDQGGWSSDVGVSLGVGIGGGGGVGLGVGVGPRWGWRDRRRDRWGDPWGRDPWGRPYGRPARRDAVVEYQVRLPFDRRVTVVQEDRAPIAAGTAVRLYVGDEGPERIAPLG